MVTRITTRPTVIYPSLNQIDTDDVLPSAYCRMTIDWTSLNEKLPTDKSEEQKEQRKSMFGSFDPNGNGYLSLAECDKGLKGIMEGLDNSGSDLFPSAVIMRAFYAAKDVAQKKGGAHSVRGMDYIEFAEFRLFLVYLKRYSELWEIFDAIDTSDDRRISLDEFKKTMPKFAEWGVSVMDPDVEFQKIDSNGGGQILFCEFADWGLKQTLTTADMDSE